MINKKLVNRVLSTPSRDVKPLIVRLCDYDLLAAANQEMRMTVYQMLISEAKRRGILRREPQPRPEPDSGNPLF